MCVVRTTLLEYLRVDRRYVTCVYNEVKPALCAHEPRGDAVLDPRRDSSNEDVIMIVWEVYCPD